MKVNQKITQIQTYKKIRKTWGMNPKTRVVPKKVKISRQSEKTKIQKQIKEEDL